MLTTDNSTSPSEDEDDKEGEDVTSPPASTEIDEVDEGEWPGEFREIEGTYEEGEEGEDKDLEYDATAAMQSESEVVDANGTNARAREQVSHPIVVDPGAYSDRRKRSEVP